MSAWDVPGAILEAMTRDDVEKMPKEPLQIVSKPMPSLSSGYLSGRSVFRDMFLGGSGPSATTPLFQPTTPPPGVTGVSVNTGVILQQPIRTTMLGPSSSSALVIETDKGDIKIGRDGSISWPWSLDEAAQKFMMTIHTQMGEFFKPFIQNELHRIATDVINELDHKDDGGTLSTYEQVTLAVAVAIKLAQSGHGHP